MLAAMLKSKPIGADERAIANWEATNMLTIEMFKTFWQKVSPDLEFPWTQAGDEASYAEWTAKMYGRDCKFQGARKPGAAKHGIVRNIGRSFIREATFYEDKLHGLSFYWGKDGYTTAFVAIIYNHDER